MAQLILPGTAGQGDVLTGKTFSGGTNYGASGSMPNNGAVTITPGNTAKPIPAGYHNGSGTVATDANLIAANIKSGVTVFGVTGTLAAGTSFASGTATSASSATTFKTNAGANVNAYALTVTGLTFTPVMVALVSSPFTNNGTAAYEEYVVRSDAIFIPGSGNQAGVYVSSSPNVETFQLDGTAAKMISGGFTLPVVQSNKSYAWYAYAN